MTIAKHASNHTVKFPNINANGSGQPLPQVPSQTMKPLLGAGERRTHQLMLIIMFQIKDYTNQPLGVTNDQTRNQQPAEPEETEDGTYDLHESRVRCPFEGLSTR